MRLEGLGNLKNPTISSGIEPATFAQWSSARQLLPQYSDWLWAGRPGFDYRQKEILSISPRPALRPTLSVIQRVGDVFRG
jgi:hypothetical protein